MLSNGRPLTLAWEKENIETIVETWFLGTEAGNAVADVLFGKYNPSGKLVMSFPYNVGQIPVYYNHKHTGRPFEPNQRYVMHYIRRPGRRALPVRLRTQLHTLRIRRTDAQQRPDGPPATPSRQR